MLATSGCTQLVVAEPFAALLACLVIDMISEFTMPKRGDTSATCTTCLQPFATFHLCSDPLPAEACLPWSRSACSHSLLHCLPKNKQAPDRGICAAG